MYIFVAKKGYIVRFTRGRVCGCASKEYRSGSITEWAIHHIRVTSDPAKVGYTSKDVTNLVVKEVLQNKEILLLLFVSLTVYVTVTF